MSAIGEYIHLNKENYLRYGTARDASSMSEQDNSLVAYSIQRKDIQDRINKMQNKNIEMQLVELKNRISNSWNDSKAAKDVVRDVERRIASIQKLQEDIIKTITKNVGTNFATSTNFTIKPEDDSAFQRLKNKYNIINYLIARINSDSTAGKSTKNKTIENLNTNIKEFFELVGVSARNLKIENRDDLDALATVNRIFSALSLNEIQNAFTMNKGDLGEAVVALTTDNAKNLAISEIKKSIVGAEKSEFGITVDMVDEEIGKIVNQNKSVKTKFNIYKVYATQDKVDVSIEINDQPIQASIKAYRPFYGQISPHLQDVSIWYNLAETTRLSQFANHWISLHSYEGLNSSGMDAVLELRVMYEALAHGNLLKANATDADTFIVINTRDGKVYANTAYNILTKYRNNFIFSPLISDIKIKNEFNENGSSHRIANIISQLQATKIKVSYFIALNSFS